LKTTTVERTPIRQARRVQPSEGDGFDRFWQAYPRKVAKPAARKAWAKLSPEQRDQAIAAAPVFAAKTRRDGTEERFTPHPATWLSNERFDEFMPGSSGTATVSGDEYLRNLARHFALTEDWDRALGPPPGLPGSKISAALLSEIRASLRKSTAADDTAFETGGRVVPFEVPHANARA
jgi:hypothetical protein